MGVLRDEIIGEKTPELTAIVRVKSCTAATLFGGTLSSMISKLMFSYAPILPISVTIAT